ncbi:MAG: hypothetical protein HY694_15150 [Deltaproteobacteria bacterium]|nr:hypothetical protein [Deltaproteobacteria bacterium]
MCQVLVPVMAFFLPGLFLAAATVAQERKALTLDELVSLIKAGVSAPRVVDLIEKHGVGFEVDEGALSKLKQAGGNADVLSAARKEGQKYEEAEQRKRDLEEVRKRVEAAKRLEEAKKRAEELREKQLQEARRKEEEKKKAEEQARLKAEEERKKAEAAKRREEEAKKLAEARRLDEEKKREQEQAEKKKIQEAKKKQAEEARQAEEAKKKEADEAKRREQEAARRAETARTGIAPTPPCVVGLRLRFQYADGGNFTRAITARQGDLCVIGSTSRSYYDKDWVLVKQVDRDGNEITSASPLNPLVAQKLLDFPLSVGKTWETSYFASASSGRVYYFTNYFTVQSYEEVAVPAGTFKAFKIQQHQVLSASSYGVRYLWYAPEVGYYVKRQWAPGESSSATYWQNVRDYEMVSVSGLK